MRGILISAIFSLAALASGPTAFAKDKPQEVVVTIENIKFEPAEVTVHPGDRIVWENKDLVPHTVTASDGKFDSKTIPPGQHWKYRAKKAGSFSYVCSFHPNMHGTLVVK